MTNKNNLKHYGIVALLILVFLFISKLVGAVLIALYVWKFSTMTKNSKILVSISLAGYFLFMFLMLLGFFPIKTFQISGMSMSPAFKTGERLIASSLTLNTLKTGDIVVHKSPAGNGVSIIRRVVGMPGETFEIRDGEVIVNGRVMNESSYTGKVKTKEGKFIREKQQIVIPKDHFVVLADNRREGTDSRDWGFVPRQDIEAKFLVKY